ncbi:MAG TPA: Hpt domain-containing protein [Candidatus Saccharimonadales bacterium]|nr:Hpt domain-containing protein [Candidatus Saccharimonadales bacterium]
MNSTDPDKSDATTMVDLDRLQSACDGDGGVMRELVDLYFRQAGEIMAGLEQAINGNAVDDVNHLAHKLAGSSLACGMSAVVPSLRKLEEGARAGHLNGAHESMADVSAQMKVVRRHVQDYLLRYPAQ